MDYNPISISMTTYMHKWGDSSSRVGCWWSRQASIWSSLTGRNKGPWWIKVAAFSRFHQFKDHHDHQDPCPLHISSDSSQRVIISCLTVNQKLIKATLILNIQRSYNCTKSLQNIKFSFVCVCVWENEIKHGAKLPTTLWLNN